MKINIDNTSILEQVIWNLYTMHYINPLTVKHHLMKFAIIFWTCASVDNRPLPGEWVAELLGVILESRTDKRSNFLSQIFARMAVEGLKQSGFKLSIVNLQSTLEKTWKIDSWFNL